MKSCSSAESSASAVGDRLRSERLRLRFSQEEFGVLGGVNRNTQGSYERGDRNPDSAYLGAIAAAGVDVLYVLTGKQQPLEGTALTAEEQEVITYFRGMSEKSKDASLRMLFGLAAADGALDSGKA